MANIINIWEPKWITREVYVSKYKVKDGPNIIHFTKTALPDLVMDGAMIRNYPLASNGTIPVYKVPIRHFDPVDNGQLSLIKED